MGLIFQCGRCGARSVAAAEWSLCHSLPRAIRSDSHDLLCRESVTVLNQTPKRIVALMQAQDRGACAHRLRHVVLGGEALDVRILRPWFARNAIDAPRISNMYGITETTVHATHKWLSAAEAENSGEG